MATRTPKEIKLVVGGESRVDLLPPEVLARSQAKRARRGLAALVVFAVLVSGGGYAFAALLAGSNGAALAAEQERTTMILKQQAEFGEVTVVENRLAAVEQAAQVGVSTEIDWKSYVDSVQAVLPEGVTITDLQSDTATPMAAYAQSESPLQGARIATLVFTGTSADIPQVERWLVSLESLPGFVDAVPGSISTGEEGGYSATITMHINTVAYSGRFQPVADEQEETE